MLYKRFEVEKKTVGIWKISESIEELLGLVNPDAALLAEIQNLHSEKRKVEKLVTCCLMREFGLDYSQLMYLPSGKPKLIGNKFHVSISHTAGFVSIALSESGVGIDIQSIDARVVNLKSRFVADDELIDPNLEITHLMLHWSAKEAMFKWIDREAVIFTKHLHVQPFSPVGKGCFQVYETKTKWKMSATAYYEVEDHFVLVLVG
ncbi:MAG: Phosphopantetheinyl transferase [Bacteroidetes bacterium]|jgi:4'-phosphopantetheinyl transferase|nr:Phosphopantetheinyl transferase [Bacteroidota bacterium]